MEMHEWRWTRKTRERRKEREKISVKKINFFISATTHFLLEIKLFVFFIKLIV